MTPAYEALGFREWEHPDPDGPADPMHAIAVQKLAVRLLEWACGVGDSNAARGLIGYAVGEYHPRYRLVTENRDWRAGKPDPNYSSCGDLAHWLLYRMGVRDARVNRAEFQTWPPKADYYAPNYRSGANVSRLTQWLPRAAPNVDTTLDAAPGDVLIIRGAPGTEHVMCVIDMLDVPHAKGKRGPVFALQTAEYGQPGGALKTVDVVYHEKPPRPMPKGEQGPGLWICGKSSGWRRVMWHIRLLDVLAEARAAGRLVAAEEPPA